MIKIILPANNQAERVYVIEQIFHDYFHLDYEIIFEFSINDVSMVCNANKRLIIKDDFWKYYKHDLEYLSIKHIPSSVIYAGKPELQDVPIIFGDDEFYIAENDVYCGVDLFASIFYMLTRWEEYVQQRDEKGLCEERLLLCVKVGLIKRPIVNEYIRLLVSLLLRIDVSVVEPDLYELLITHDVDRCYLSSFSELMYNLKPAFLSRKYRLLYRVLKNYMCYRLVGKNPFLPFDEIMNFSDELDLKNVFYFKATDIGEMGCTYTLDDGIVKDVILNILARGHKVGFHPSELTYNNDVQFRTEADRLNKLVGCFEGGRNHALYSNLNTMYQWSQCSSYVSNMGYQTYNGFRCGICYPFRVFDIYNRVKLNLFEIPFVAMDSVAIRNKWTPSQMFDDVVDVIEEVHKYKGIVCLNWHTNQFNTNERKKFKSNYYNLIRYAAERR